MSEIYTRWDNIEAFVKAKKNFTDSSNKKWHLEHPRIRHEYENKYTIPDLRGLSVVDFSISSVDYSGSDLRGAKFVKGVLNDVGFQLTIFDGVEFVDCNIYSVQMSEIYAKRSLFKLCRMSVGVIMSARLRESCFQACDVSGVSFDDACMDWSNISDSSFKKCNFLRVKFDFARVVESKFIECEFHKMSFEKVGLNKVVFDGCEFLGVDFSGVNLDGVVFRNCKFGFWLWGSEKYANKLDLNDEIRRSLSINNCSGMNSIEWNSGEFEYLKKHPRTPAGEPCPADGYWFSPAKVGSRQYFKCGEVMPDLKSSSWETLWQWDINQMAD